MTRSQSGQDDAIIEFFGEKTDGYFLDIGANSLGEDTLLLEESGWSGICVEPLEIQFSELSSKRKCICKNICIGDKNGEVDFLMNEGYTSALSGVLEYYCDAHKQRIQTEKNSMGGQSFLIKREMKTLTTLLDEENAPSHIEVLKIDAEGGEFSILSGIDFSKYTFDLITIEGNYQEEVDRCVSLLSENGYSFLKFVGIDIFFGRTNESE